MGIHGLWVLQSRQISIEAVMFRVLTTRTSSPEYSSRMIMSSVRALVFLAAAEWTFIAITELSSTPVFPLSFDCPEFTIRFSTGTGVFAPTPFTEETEAVGLSNLQPLRDLEAERAWSASADLGWKSSQLELNGSFFGSVIRDPIALLLPPSAGGSMEIVNAQAPTRTLGSEFLMRVRRGNFGITGTHTFVYSTEVDPNEAGRREVPLTPRHSVGVVGMWRRTGKAGSALKCSIQDSSVWMTTLIELKTAPIGFLES